MSAAIKSVLTRREVLKQLKKVGVRGFSQLKRDCREYEQYMAVNYDYEIVKRDGHNISGNKPKKSYRME